MTARIHKTSVQYRELQEAHYSSKLSSIADSPEMAQCHATGIIIIVLLFNVQCLLVKTVNKMRVYTVGVNKM